MCKHVLVIDDSESIRLHLTTILQENGHKFTTAVDGKNALRKLDGEKFDIIICDVNMPIMDGLEFVKEVKTNSDYYNYRFVPIVMLTTVNEEDSKLQGQISGVRAWIVKPIVPEMLLKIVDKLSK